MPVIELISGAGESGEAGDGVDEIVVAGASEVFSPDTGQLLRLAQYNLFPNSSVLVWGDELNVLLALPGRTPDTAELVVFVLHRVPSPDKPRRRPRDHVFPPDGDLGPVFNQDVSVLKTAQRGLEQPGLTHLALSSEECRIVNLHRNLEHYLGISPARTAPEPRVRTQRQKGAPAVCEHPQAPGPYWAKMSRAMVICCSGVASQPGGKP